MPGLIDEKRLPLDPSEKAQLRSRGFRSLDEYYEHDLKQLADDQQFAAVAICIGVVVGLIIWILSKCV